MGDRDSLDNIQEKSPIEPEDYAGLQLDPRFPRPTTNGWGSDDGFSQNDREPGAPELVPTEYSSPVDSETFYFPTVTGKGTMMIAEDTLDKKVLERPVVTEPQAPESGEVDTRTRGFWKRHFILLWSVVVAMIIIIAVLGGIFGARSAAATSYSSSPSPSTHSPSSPASATPVATQAAAPSSINANLPPTDVIVASSIAPVANYTGGSEGYNLFFQSANGHTKFAWKSGLEDSWTPANAIFTDAVNGTGLAGIAYPNTTTINSTVNSTEPQTSIFYVQSGGLFLGEKRVDRAGSWQMGPLAGISEAVSGNASAAGDDGWNGFKLTAVYSASFSTGPGARLYFHQANSTSNWVQELVWLHNNDSWARGSQIFGLDPNAHLSAVVEAPSQTLRLFYSTPDNAIKEFWSNITSPTPAWQAGVNIPNILLNPSAHLSAVSVANATFLYYSSSLSSTSNNVTIREQALSLLPATSLPAQTPTIVAQPALQATDTGGKNASYFVPLGAVGSDEDGSITVFYTEGAVDPRSGYSGLTSVYRMADGQWSGGGSSQNRAAVPLGYDD